MEYFDGFFLFKGTRCARVEAFRVDDVDNSKIVVE